MKIIYSVNDNIWHSGCIEECGKGDEAESSTDLSRALRDASRSLCPVLETENESTEPRIIQVQQLGN